MMTKQEFFQKMQAVWSELNNLHEQAQDTEQKITQLEQAGIANATIHIRSDNGGVELLHPTGSTYEKETGRRREYIGKKQEAIDQAKARVERFKLHQELKQKLTSELSRIIEIERQIERLNMIALGRQAKLFSVMGTAQHTAGFQSVPKDWKWLTPQMVIDYFKQSTDLAAIAGDVQEVLGKLVWNDTKAA